MNRRSTVTFLAVILCFFRPANSGESQAVENLLQNPQFGYCATTKSSEQGNSVTCWNTDSWGDISAIPPNKETESAVSCPGNLVCIKPGKRIWQFATVSDLSLSNGDSVSLAVNGFQKQKKALQARVCLMMIESAEGSWSPTQFGFRDKRTFSRHGRGELIRSVLLEASSDDVQKEFLLTCEGLKIDASFQHQKESSASFRNVVGVLVEFKNVSQQDVWVHSPKLVKGSQARIEAKSSRSLPEYYRQIPRTLQKLTNGEPVYILTLGSSIDRGSANPQLYLYDENSKSADYKKPLSECRTSTSEEIARLLVEQERRPDLQNYIGWWQHYFMYTGRTRLELMRKFNYPVNRILLNVMACDGSSIGESHSGFQEYSELKLPPDPNRNGHPKGKSWNELYPDFFRDGKTPAPDLIIFGHGHNEHIDRPDEIAAYEGAIRWFQKRYPKVEFVSCMWIRDKGNQVSIWGPMQNLCNHYGIPFIDAAQMLIDLEHTCNKYAIAPDGGHPGAAAHYLWFKQLEKLFEIPPNPQVGLPQRYLPERMNKFTYGWEGNITRFLKPNPRIVNDKMMIIEDCAFNIWTDNKKKNELTKLLIDGKPAVNAGHGRHRWSKPYPRNSSFVHGRLQLGDRHIIEIPTDQATLTAVDCKICPNRKFIAADSNQWEGKRSVQPFVSTWGAPYGTRMFKLAKGDSIEISIEATDLSIAYLDQPTGGILVSEVDGNTVWSQPTDIPYEDSANKKHFIENRRGVNGLHYRKHRIKLRAEKSNIWILGLFTYDSREAVN